MDLSQHIYKVLFVFFTLSQSVISWSAESCYPDLLGGKWGDSYHHTLPKDDFNPLNKSSVKRLVTNILIRSKCQKPLLEKNVLGCQRVFKTKICRVDYHYGYFIVFPDGTASYNVVFNRWD